MLFVCLFMPMLWRVSLVLLPLTASAGAVRLKQTVDVRRPGLIRRDFEISELGTASWLRFAAPFVCSHQPLDHTDKQPDPLRRQIHLKYSDAARDEAIRAGLDVTDELCLDISEVVEDGIYGPHSFGDIIRPTKRVLDNPREQQRVAFKWCDVIFADSPIEVEPFTRYRFRSSSHRGP